MVKRYFKSAGFAADLFLWVFIAGRANVAQYSGPRSIEGKRRISPESAPRHGLASSGIVLDLGAPTLAALVEKARGLEFSSCEPEELVTRLAAARDVIDAKHASF